MGEKDGVSRREFDAAPKRKGHQKYLGVRRSSNLGRETEETGKQTRKKLVSPTELSK